MERIRENCSRPVILTRKAWYSKWELDDECFEWVSEINQGESSAWLPEEYEGQSKAPRCRTGTLTTTFFQADLSGEVTDCGTYLEEPETCQGSEAGFQRIPGNICPYVGVRWTFFIVHRCANTDGDDYTKKEPYNRYSERVYTFCTGGTTY
jgi:hypothetical protein